MYEFCLVDQSETKRYSRKLLENQQALIIVTAFSSRDPERANNEIKALRNRQRRLGHTRQCEKCSSSLSCRHNGCLKLKLSVASNRIPRGQMSSLYCYYWPCDRFRRADTTKTLSLRTISPLLRWPDEWCRKENWFGAFFFHQHLMWSVTMRSTVSLSPHEISLQKGLRLDQAL